MKKIVYISDLTKKLKLLRHKYDLTQDDVANALEIHRSTYAYYEIGRTIPSIGILKALSRLYRVPIDFFLDTNYEEHETDTDCNPINLGRTKWNFLLGLDFPP